ncbi:MAG: YaaR family protein [Spirochaetaceae bacterium]|jgi:uncharacterized protein YaaR (DUF327 family)|nr:YaaR family protein [Spirochaetaceae bacterium]
MDKVDFPESPFFNPALYAHNTDAKKLGDKEKIRGTRKTSFTDLLEKSGQSAETEALRELPPSEEALKELLDGVHSAGDTLKNRPFSEEIKQYKKAVRDFLHYVVENGYTVIMQEGIPNYQKPGFKGPPEEKFKAKAQILVQVVDRKLEQLAAGILAGQHSQMEILAKVEEINGLLIDLLQ